MDGETIFVVVGESGEYSARMEWCVLAVRSEERAQSIVTEYDRIGREIEIELIEHEKRTPLPDYRDRSTAADARRKSWNEERAAISRRHPDPRFYGDGRYHYSQIALV